MVKKLLFRLFKYLPIKKNRILFIGYYGAQYGCNPKYISEYLTTHFAKEIDVFWAFTEPSKYKIPEIRKVRFGSLRYLRILATSHFIITNYRMTQDFIKRIGQIYIQTWHSSLRLKKIEGDAENSLPTHYVDMAKHDSAQTDYVIAGCQMSHNTFAKSFWYSGKILDIGTPRNDLLLNGSNKQVSEIKKKILGDCQSKIVLYAPTFRKDKNTACYKLDFSKLKESLHSTFGGEWQILTRLHPHLINCQLFNNTDGIIDVTHYDDIQELLMISDVLVTDYSSLMFDFAISSKPVFLFAKDKDDYCKNDRALYLDIEELPFPLATNDNQMSLNIRMFNPLEYKHKISIFNDKVGSYERGEASRIVSELIINSIRS